MPLGLSGPSSRAKHFEYSILKEWEGTLTLVGFVVIVAPTMLYSSIKGFFRNSLFGYVLVV